MHKCQEHRHPGTGHDAGPADHMWHDASLARTRLMLMTPVTGAQILANYPYPVFVSFALP
ncbi:hypothetical protein GCM10009780_75190 [Actinomadura alba]